MLNDGARELPVPGAQMNGREGGTDQVQRHCLREAGCTACEHQQPDEPVVRVAVEIADSAVILVWNDWFQLLAVFQEIPFRIFFTRSKGLRRMAHGYMLALDIEGLVPPEEVRE